MRIENDIKLDFSNVLIKPKRSTLTSRKEVNIERNLSFINSKQSFRGIPIIAANMDTTGTFSMAKAFHQYKMCVAIHKHYSLENLTTFFSNPQSQYSFYSTGILETDLKKLDKFMQQPGHCLGICVDVANGYTERFISTISRIRSKYPNTTILAGNVVTPETTEQLILSGADIVKCGIGSGCFAAGTKILMANGMYKYIEDIQIGEKVINMHGKPVKVVRSFSTGIKKVIKFTHPFWNQPTLVTSDHQFLVKTSTEKRKPVWKCISEAFEHSILGLFPGKVHFESLPKVNLPTYLKPSLIERGPGSVLQDIQEDFHTAPFSKVEETDLELQVFDLEVDCPTHSFIANNLIVHNSSCITRRQAGVGYPQLSAIIECADAAHGLGGQICSDGGITVPGDLGKAFGAGADFLMLGGVFSAHKESECEIIKENAKEYMMYYGMSSDTAMNKYSGGVAEYRASEGKTVKLPYRGPVENTIKEYLGGLRSTCTYVGARNLKELSKRTTFIRVNNQLNEVFGSYS